MATHLGSWTHLGTAQDRHRYETAQLHRVQAACSTASRRSGDLVLGANPGITVGLGVWRRSHTDHSGQPRTAHQTHQHALLKRQQDARAFLLAGLPRTTHPPRTKRAASSATRRIAVRSSRTDARRVQIALPSDRLPIANLQGPVPEADLNPALTRAKRARQAFNLCKPANLQACTRRTPPGIHGAHPSRKLMGSAPFASRSLPPINSNPVEP